MQKNPIDFSDNEENKPLKIEVSAENREAFSNLWDKIIAHIQKLEPVPWETINEYIRYMTYPETAHYRKNTFNAILAANKICDKVDKTVLNFTLIYRSLKLTQNEVNDLNKKFFEWKYPDMPSIGEYSLPGRISYQSEQKGFMAELIFTLKPVLLSYSGSKTLAFRRRL